jgi:sugar/nucleoside kinase (ribokinase family)
VTAVDAVGAGDSFDAGFIFKWLLGGDLDECLRFGNMCGALSVTRAGGTAAFQNSEQIFRDFKNYFGYEEKQLRP